MPNAETTDRQQGGPRRETLLLLVLALLVGSVALVGAPTAAVLYDQIRDWQAVHLLLGARALPLQGATISGVGANGPLYYLLLMVGQIFAMTEVGMARFVTAVALLGAVVWVLIGSKGDNRRFRAWIGIVIASHPLVLEWVRLGADFSYLPVLLPLGAAAYRSVERRPRKAHPWLLWGLVCGATMQLHVTTVPLLLAASWMLWRVPRRLWAPVLVLIGTASTYISTIPYFAGGTAALSWWQLPITAAQLGHALVSAAAVPAAALGTVGFVGAWTTLVLFAVALGSWRYEDVGGRFLAVVAIASLAFVSFDPQSHYNHLMHLDIVLVFGLAAGAQRLARGPAGKALLTLIVLFQCVVSGAAIRESGQTGLVRRYTAFPLEWPAVIEVAATAEFRDRLVAQLRAEGLGTPWQRLHLVSGDTLSVAEHGWVFYLDPPSTPSWRQGPPLSPAFELRRGTCGERAGHDLPGHCLIRTGREPSAAHVVLTNDSALPSGTRSQRSLADARHAWTRERRAFPEAMAPLIIDWADNFPKRIEPADPSQRIGLVRLRQFRFPDARAGLGDVRVVARARADRVATTHGYLLVERQVHFSVPVTQITLDVTDGADRGAFDLEIELVSAGFESDRDGEP